MARVTIKARQPASRLIAVANAILLALVGLSLILAGCSGAKEREKAPLFNLPSADGRQVSLAPLLQERDAVVIVFYRGFF